jgi:hypothetical protein
MLPFNALSLAPDVRRWLKISRHPRILHVFDQACNLINERGDVLSIVTLQIGNGPFNLVIEDDVFFSEHLHEQSSISIRGSQLLLGDLTINIADARLWSPRPDWETLHAKRDDILARTLPLRALIRAKQSPHESGTASPQITLLATTGFTNHQSPILEFSNSLSASIIDADLSSSTAAARQLAGLGMGLTPSGDDFIMGAILAAWIIHPVGVAKVFAGEIADIAAPLTTSLSAAWLRSAGKGQAGVLWHEFFDALNSGTPAEIQLQIKKLLSVGETSGADALSGFLGTFGCWREISSHNTS